MDAVKKQLRLLLRPGHDISSILLEQLGWPARMPQPYKILEEVSGIMSRLRTVMRLNWESKDVDQLQRRWCCFESPNLFKERWEKMFNNFCATHAPVDDSATTTASESDAKKKPQVYCPDLSGIPELYDSLKYDALHNHQFLEAIFSDPETIDSSAEPISTDLRNLYTYVRALYNFVAPQEYGITDAEKKNIGMLIGLPLLKQILRDLEDFKQAEKPKTRLYFTKGTKLIIENE